MKLKKLTYLLVGFVILIILIITISKRINFNSDYVVGQPIDSLNSVFVYYNGSVSNVIGRNTSGDGYNLGLKYQCVEFVKRYYYQYLKHKMPDSYGDAKDFFDKDLKDGELNFKRNLYQYSNPSKSKPLINDLLIFNGTIFNIHGHVAIVSKVADDKIEIIQQNPGPLKKSRELFSLKQKDGKWYIDNTRIVGWLRKK
ncbi:CHAP domain containing protein [uncultured Paludibacter sp.]|uniref:CHAP domain containing protein n=1 Tax=uncultured Paludibacter sp. TaxID=497635 RepID=A0A653AGI6_9BACT|nr:CHAP domain containing protein [uncultured Paludibacter sp.]